MDGEALSLADSNLNINAGLSSCLFKIAAKPKAFSPTKYFYDTHGLIFQYIFLSKGFKAPIPFKKLLKNRPIEYKKAGYANNYFKKMSIFVSRDSMSASSTIPVHK